MCGIVGYIGNRQAYDILIKGKVIAIVTEGDKVVIGRSYHSIPKQEECLYPILTSIPAVTGLSYVVVKGCDVDQPGNGKIRHRIG